MNILLFFILTIILVAGCWTAGLTDWRVRTRLNADDILELVDKSSSIEDFKRMLNNRFKGSGYGVINRGTVADKISNLNRTLMGVHTTFIVASYAYVEQYLFEYFQLAMQMIREKDGGAHSDEDVRESIRFPDDYEHCMLAEFHDARFDVDWLYEIIGFLQTIHRKDGYPLDHLTIPLRQYSRLYDEYLESPDNELLLHSPITGYAALDSRLNEVKRKITDFSRIFCARWRPYSSHLHVTRKAESHDVRIQRHFVRHVFNDEKCVIMFTPATGHYVESQKNWISYWNCDYILTSDEYRLQKYEDEVTIETSAGLPLTEGEREFSLATLKEQLISNNYYLNVVKYYNITSEVVLLASIKEGRKIFKGINHAVNRSCQKNTTKLVDEVRGLRSKLSAFLSVFEKLVVLLLDYKHINVINVKNNQMHDFDERASSVMEMLNIPDDHKIGRINRICGQLPEDLLKHNAHLGNNTFAQIKFDYYYFTEPLLNISQLYHFVTNDF